MSASMQRGERKKRLVKPLNKYTNCATQYFDKSIIYTVK